MQVTKATKGAQRTQRGLCTETRCCALPPPLVFFTNGLTAGSSLVKKPHNSTNQVQHVDKFMRILRQAPWADVREQRGAKRVHAGWLACGAARRGAFSLRSARGAFSFGPF